LLIFVGQAASLSMKKQAASLSMKKQAGSLSYGFPKLQFSLDKP
jgi:hypothetical protein